MNIKIKPIIKEDIVLICRKKMYENYFVGVLSMNIKVIMNSPAPLSKNKMKEAIKEVEIFCSCGLRLGSISFDESVVCPECGKEYHLQEGFNHFHIITNKPSN